MDADRIALKQFDLGFWDAGTGSNDNLNFRTCNRFR